MVFHSDLSSGTIATSIKSSSYFIQPPSIVNEHLIPACTYSAMTPAWRQGIFLARDVVGILLKNVTIAGEGLVFDQDDRLIKETKTQHSDQEVSLAYSQVIYTKKISGPIQEDLCVLCVKRGANNYGHWLLEMLPKAGLAIDNIKDKRLKFIIPFNNGKLKSSIMRSLILLGVKPSQIIELTPYPMKFKQVLVFDGLTDHGAFISPLAVAQCRKLTTRGSNYSKKLYISRRSARFRRAANEHRITEVARSRGFTTIDPGEISFDQQRALFSDASEIVGIMGAGMSGIVFSPPNAKVTTIAPASMPDTFFWFLAGLSNHVYKEVRCASIGGIENPMAWDADMEISKLDLNQIFC